MRRGICSHNTTGYFRNVIRFLIRTIKCYRTLYMNHSVHDNVKQTCHNMAQKFPNDIENSSMTLDAEGLLEN